MPDDMIASLALGGAAYGLAAMIVLAIPLAIATRALRLYLRVARFATPAAMIIEDDDDVVLLQQRRRAPRLSLQAFSSAELRFFREGDELSNGV